MGKRRGRKLGTFEVTSGDASATVLARVDYFLDNSDGWFFANVVAGEVLQSASRDELEKAVRNYHRSRHAIEYAPYIEVEVPEPFARETVVVGVDFNLLMVSTTQVTEREGKPAWVVKAGYHDDDGVPRLRADSDRSARTRQSLEGLIPYTKERWATLEQIETAVVEMRAKLDQVLAEPAALDAIKSGGLLALAAVPAPSKKKGENDER